MMKRVPSFLTPIVAAGLAVAGCSAQVDPHYRGEPLATIEGSVVTEGEAAPSNVDAALVWMTVQANAHGYEPKIVGSRVSVTGSFPAKFTLNVVTPPPKEGEWLGPVLTDPGVNEPVYRPSGIWIGMIVALERGARDAELHPRDIVGVDLGHVVVYFDHDHDAPTTAGSFNVPPTKGFHLARKDPGTPQAVAAYDRCRWGGFCRHEVGNTNAYKQDMLDWEYARCTTNMPSAQTCTLVAGQPWPETENQDCLKAASDGGCALPLSFPSNPQGFSDPVTVVLGKTMWDLWRQ